MVAIESSRTESDNPVCATEAPRTSDAVGKFNVRLSDFESAVMSLARSASCAEEAMFEAVLIAAFCREVQNTSVAISLADTDLGLGAGAYAPVSESLYQGSNEAMLAVRRMGVHASTLIESLKSVGALLSEISASLDLPTAAMDPGATAMPHPRPSGP